MKSPRSQNSDLSIPIELSKFHVVLRNNVYPIECRAGLSMRLLSSKHITRTIIEAEHTIAFETVFTESEDYLFNSVLDKADISADELFAALKAADAFFTSYEVSRKTQLSIDQHINGLGKYVTTWLGLTTKPDYNLTLFKNRTLPYFNVENKEWAKANMSSKGKTDYPVEISNPETAVMIKQSTTNEYDEELKCAQFNNNFAEWGVLPIEAYANMNLIIEKIQTLFKLGLKRQGLSMICRYMLSPQECHIIREPAIWEILDRELVNKHINEIVRYCMFYSMYILRHEETIMFSQVNVKSRVLFKIDQAAKLNSFHLSHIEKSPYIIQLTQDTPLGQCMPMYLSGKRSINTLTEFKRRFNIVTGGAFNGVDFKAYDACITGSILIPCVHKSPLENGFDDVDWNRDRSTKLSHPYMIDTPTTAEDFAFANYLEYYYPSYVSLTDSDFREQVLGAESQQQYETPKDEGDLIYESDTTTIPSNLGGIRTSEAVKKDNVVASPVKLGETENKSQKNATEYNQLADIDVAISTWDHNVFKERVFKLYQEIVNNCKHRGPVYIKEVITIASIKYKIYGPGLPRPMDVFRVPYDFVKMVKKFHVHCVKMFYNGDVTLFRSCVSCLLSGVGESYKWFSCNKVPADVLLKYAQRGFTIILNSKERETISKYVKDNDRWGTMFKMINIEPEKIYCCVTENHPFFRPGLHKCGIRMGLRKFERDNNNLYPNILVVSKPRQVFSYGEVITHDMTKVYPPNVRLINSVLDLIEYGDHDNDATIDVEEVEDE